MGFFEDIGKGFAYGIGGTLGFFATKAGLKVASALVGVGLFVVGSGYLRATGYEERERLGEVPDDGIDHLGVATLYYGWANVRDLTAFLVDLGRAATKDMDGSQTHLNIKIDMEAQTVRTDQAPGEVAQEFTYTDGGNEMLIVCNSLSLPAIAETLDQSLRGCSPEYSADARFQLS